MRIFERLTAGLDPAQVRDELVAAKEPERRARAKEAQQEVERLGWRGPRERTSKRRRAALIAWAGTATARKLTSDFWRIGFQLGEDPELADDVYAVLAARGRPFFETLARGLLRTEGTWSEWQLVRRAVREGLIAPPEGDEYVRGLVDGVTSSIDAFRQLDSTYRGLLADPALLEEEVWLLFEVDAGGELSNANTWEEKEQGKPAAGFSRGDNRWLYALTRLSAEGRLERGRLLDASLDALMRDFRASTVGWYAQLHEELEPTREERVARLDRYLALVTSPAPSVVKEGLAALRAVEDAVPPEAFARVAPSPFTQRQKNLSTETLSLLGRLCKRSEVWRPALLEAAAHALAHERVDVQERALKLLEQYPQAAPRALLLGYVEAVSTTLRPRLEALTGVQTPVVPPTAAIEIRGPVQPRPTPEGVRAAAAPLVPVESVDELVELAAALLEGQGSGDDCERLLDGVSRLCGERPAAFERRTAGLAQRAGETAAWGRAASGAELVAYVVEAWLGRRAPRGAFGSSRSVFGLLARRAEEVARRAARGLAHPLLALPTHAGGWLDPETLAMREQDAGRVRSRPDPVDRAHARLRAFPALEPARYGRRLQTTTQWGRTTHELEVECVSAPAELRELGVLGTTHASWYGGGGWAGVDALGVRWGMTALPGHPEIGFAGATVAAAAARDGTAYHHPDAVLEHALASGVPLGPEAWLATAACLVAKPPELPRAAGDLLVASVEDGRFDAGALGADLAWLADNGLGKVGRLRAPLRDVARVSPLHAAQVVRLVEGLLAQLRSRPSGLHGLLELALEGTTTTGRRIEDARARATLTAIAGEVSSSSKLGRLARGLLAD